MIRRASSALAILALTAAILAAALASGVLLQSGREVASEISNSLALLTYAAVGALIAVRRPSNSVGWILLALGLSWQIYLVSGSIAALTFDRTGSLEGLPSLVWLPMNLWQLSLGLLPLLVMFFPTGRPPGRLWTPLAWLSVAAAVVAVLTGSTIVGEVSVRSPFADAAPALSDALLPMTVSLAALGSIFVRYRRAAGDERQQIKVLAFATLAAVAVIGGLGLAMELPAVRSFDPAARFPAEFLAGVPTALAFAGIPIAIGIAILRYRLYDIDILINRTLVYGAVTALLAATYFGAVVIIQALLRPFTSGSELAVAVSTLLVVALFQPIRGRVQDAVDRRFYRSRYDAARTLDVFSARLRNEVELDAVRTDLLIAVGDTVRPVHASLWLRR